MPETLKTLLSDGEKEMLQVYADMKGISLEEALKRACIAHLDSAFNQRPAEVTDIRPFLGVGKK